MSYRSASRAYHGARAAARRHDILHIAASGFEDISRAAGIAEGATALSATDRRRMK